MKEEIIVVRYDRSRMVLRLDKLFPRTKGWLEHFLKYVLCLDVEHEQYILDHMISYLKNVRIPYLTEELKGLDKDIESAHDAMLACQPRSFAREGATWKWRQLKNRKARWDNYCAQFDKNVEILEAWKEKRYGDVH